MKKFYSAAVTVAVAALALTACGGPASSTAQSSGGSPTFGDCKVTGQPGSLKLKTQTPDTLTVATVLPNPGWWNGTNPSSVKDGFEYCMAADIAYRAGLKSVQVKNLAWDQYISGTATGYDIGLAATTITDKRKQILDFSKPYFSSNLGVATKANSTLSADDLRDAKIGVLQGNIGAQWVADTLKPSKTTATFQSQADMFTALSAGQVDAAITDTTLALTSVKATNGALTVKGQYKLDQGYGVVLPHGSENTSAVDKVVGEMDSDGTLKDLSAQYLKPMFGIDPNEVPIWSAK
ncbi:ABC transporter substrate-binding protein [Arthrobacter bambusae]|uniref:ABC transporter substrate-binding protein n=1 Tax=Arthrobacter bambusae TaxID=1338426 RepID=UPI00277EBB15|nr:ABC transporter substrate-binding protein [Arthrobacter bambusae]MDQ0029937.1 polar amino acid transport system substrate-binding protein [Arthrobacter bambusae]MDQ0097545.1 polar amino acid transport system substrate-binding protein [Arthrobacter bambusae]